MIDAHVHLWRLGEHGCVWPTADLPRIHRTIELPELRALAEANGIDGVILVQSQEDVADTEWLLSLADDPLVKGVVGWADLGAPIPSHPALKGLRPMVQDRAADWYDDPALDAGLHAMTEAGLVLDALIRPRHLASLARLARRHSDLTVVIDHAAKPVADDLDGWADDLREIAICSNVSCKLSGLLTEPGIAEAVDRVFDSVWRAFGPDRLIWGSDWPVLTLAGDYRGWHAEARRLVPVEHHQSVFDGNARRLYRLTREE